MEPGICIDQTRGVKRLQCRSVAVSLIVLVALGPACRERREGAPSTPPATSSVSTSVAAAPDSPGFHHRVMTAERIDTSFFSKSKQELQVSAKAQGGLIEGVSLRLGAFTLQLTIDRLSDRASTKGGPLKLTTADRTALREFVEHVWANPASGTSAETNLLLKRVTGLAALLYEGPETFLDFDIKMGKPRSIGSPTPMVRCCPCGERGKMSGICDDCPGNCDCYPDGCGSGPACVKDEPGDDGVLMIFGDCCYSSPPGAPYPQSHDACLHTMKTFPDVCGWTQRTETDGRNWCEGRCGIGCAAAPIYTQDCLDHDRCLAHRDGHVDAPSNGGPTNTDCGDEFNEAVGDFAVIYFGTLGASFLECSNCPQPCTN